jgi:hypothetical protein
MALKSSKCQLHLENALLVNYYLDILKRLCCEPVESTERGKEHAKGEFNGKYMSQVK